MQAGGEHLGTLRRSLSSPLDLIRHVDEEIAGRINGLINRGELNEEEGQNILQKLLTQGRRGDKEEIPVDEAYVEQLLADRGVPSRDDFQRLESQLEQLATKLEQMNS